MGFPGVPPHSTSAKPELLLGLPSVAVVTDELRGLSVELSLPHDDSEVTPFQDAAERAVKLDLKWLVIPHGSSAFNRAAVEEVRAQVSPLTEVVPKITLGSLAEVPGQASREFEGILEHYGESGAKTVLLLPRPEELRGQTLPEGEFSVARALERASELGLVAGTTVRPTTFLPTETRLTNQMSERDAQNYYDTIARQLVPARFAITSALLDYYSVEEYREFMEAMLVRGIEEPIIPSVRPYSHIDDIEHAAEQDNDVLPEGLSFEQYKQRLRSVIHNYSSKMSLEDIYRSEFRSLTVPGALHASRGKRLHVVTTDNNVRPLLRSAKVIKSFVDRV